MRFPFPKLQITNCLVLFFASALQAFGMYHIHSLSGVTEGGVFGLVLLIWHWLDISPAISSLVLNIACFALGWRVLGREFIGYSLIAISGYSIGYGIFEQFPRLWPALAQMPLVASVLGALFIGVGAGLCVRAGGATGGDDAIAMSVQKLTGLPVEKTYLISDLAVLLLSLSYIPLTRIAWSVLTVVLSGQIIGLIQRIPGKKVSTKER